MSTKSSTAVATTLRLKYYFSRSNLSSRVKASSLIWPLFVNTFTTGMMDAVSFAEFAIFSSNQTGNVIILLSRAIGVQQRYYPGGSCSGPSLLTTGVSLASFLVCAFILGRIGFLFGNLHRGFLVASTGVQAIFLLIAAALIQAHVLPPNDSGAPYSPPRDKNLDAIPVALLSASSGLQVAQARCSGVQEVPTAMLTSPMVDFLIHSKLFLAINAKDARSRNIRLIYLISFFVGIAIGATIHRFAGTAIVTYVTFALRVGNMIVFWFLPSDR